MRQLTLLATLALLSGCHAGEPLSRTHPVYPSQAFDEDLAPLSKSDLAYDAFNYQTKGPLEFLEMLRVNFDRDAPLPGYAVWGSHRGWILESDVPELLKLIESNEPCLGVQKEICSFIPWEGSTVGREAAFLIRGFRAEHEGWGYGGYPPSLDSSREDIDAEALRAWWADWQSKRGK